MPGQAVRRQWKSFYPQDRRNKNYFILFETLFYIDTVLRKLDLVLRGKKQGDGNKS